MDDKWERTYPLMALEPGEAERLLARALPRGVRIGKLVPMAEGKRNSNFRVATLGGKDEGGGDLVLRLFAADDGSWRREAGLRRRLPGDVPLQPLLDAGETETPDGKRGYAIYGYAPGQSLLERIVAGGGEPDARLMTELGRVAAAIHSVGYERHGFLNGELEAVEPIAPLADWYDLFLNERARSRLGADLAAAIERIPLDYKDELAEIESGIGLVHGDYRPTNLIVRDDALAAVIDWEFALSSHPIADAGQLFRYDRDPASSAKRSFAQGYNERAERPLSARWTRLAPLRDLPNLLQMLGVEAELPRKHADLRRLIEATMAELARAERG